MSTNHRATCPECATSFNVAEEHLQHANGMVRCGICLYVFNALEEEKKPESDVKPAFEDEKTIIEAPPKQKNHDDDFDTDYHFTENNDEDAGEALAYARSNTDIKLDDEPFELSEKDLSKPFNPLRTGLFLGLNLLLLASIMLQFGLIERKSIRDNEIALPFLQLACSHLQCPADTFRNVERISITASQIKQDGDTLKINLSLINLAPYPQPPPVVELRFYSTQGETMAMAQLTPDQYMAIQRNFEPLHPQLAQFEIHSDAAIDPQNYAFELLPSAHN